MGAQSRWTSIATFPFDVSKTAWNTSGVFSIFGAGFRAASFLLSSGDEHPPSAKLTAALTASHQLFRIVPQYAMLAFGALPHGGRRRRGRDGTPEPTGAPPRSSRC